MYELIQISKINDFLFSPESIFYHSVYESFSNGTFHQNPQIAGNLAHESIDNAVYSTKKDIVQGKSVYSENFRLVGKIDILDLNKKHLIERKKKVKNIYTGYRYQLYAQMVCLAEEGIDVEELVIHSLDDNKRYFLGLPSVEELDSFFEVLFNIWNYKAGRDFKQMAENKFQNCIYKNLIPTNA